MKFTQLAKSLQETLAPVYLIEGEEAYFRDHAVAAIRSACALCQPVLNDVRYEGEALKGDALTSFLSDLRTLPFFDERRLARVYGLYPTEREWETALKKYCENPCPTTVLVIVNAGKKAGAADLKRKAGLTYVDCSRADEEELSRWLFALMRRAGLDPDANAVQLITRYCALDAARMKKETEKLVSLLGEGGRVDCAVVEEYVPKDTEYRIYELTQAASRGNASAFFEILNDLLKKGYDENAALASLTAHSRTLAEISSMQESDAEICKALSLKPYPLQKNRETVKRLGAARVKELYTALYTLSCGAKSGLYNKSGALSSAIAKIFFR